MSIERWPIVLYGVRCDDLKIKKEYCGEDFEQNDVWDFLCSFHDLFNDYGLVFYHDGDDGIYIGIPPMYPWNDSHPNKYKTESDANKVITDFMFEYFDIKISEDDFKKEISYVKTFGWG